MKRTALATFLLLAGCGGATRNDLLDELGGADRVRLQSVRQAGAYVCGEASIRDGAGVYRGYRRFVHDPAARWTRLDPGATAPRPQTDRAACAQREAYKSAFDRFACAAPEEAAANSGAEDFAQLWSRACN